MTEKDVSNAYALFSQNLAGLRGKAVRQKPENVEMDYVHIPWSLVETNKYVTLTADVMFVNSLPFVVKFGQGIGLLTAEFTPTWTAKQLACNLSKIVSLHSLAGFVVQIIIMDMEFNKVIPQMPQTNINTTAASEHVAEIERRIRIIKERCRATLSTMTLRNYQTSWQSILSIPQCFG